MWITLIMMLISYFMSAKSGNSKGKSAAIAATVGLGTYWASQNVDVVKDANKSVSNLFRTTDSSANTAREGSARETIVGIGAGASTGGSTISSLGSSAAGVLKSWGPVGTVGAVAGVTAATTIDWAKWLPWAAAGVGIFLLTRDSKGD